MSNIVRVRSFQYVNAEAKAAEENQMSYPISSFSKIGVMKTTAHQYRKYASLKLMVVRAVAVASGRPGYYNWAIKYKIVQVNERRLVVKTIMSREGPDLHYLRRGNDSVLARRQNR